MKYSAPPPPNHYHHHLNYSHLKNKNWLASNNYKEPLKCAVIATYLNHIDVQKQKRKLDYVKTMSKLKALGSGPPIHGLGVESVKKGLPTSSRSPLSANG